jgi:hypothetical protein
MGKDLVDAAGRNNWTSRIVSCRNVYGVEGRTELGDESLPLKFRGLFGRSCLVVGYCPPGNLIISHSQLATPEVGLRSAPSALAAGAFGVLAKRGKAGWRPLIGQLRSVRYAGPGLGSRLIRKGRMMGFACFGNFLELSPATRSKKTRLCASTSYAIV